MNRRSSSTTSTSVLPMTMTPTMSTATASGSKQRSTLASKRVLKPLRRVSRLIVPSTNNTNKHQRGGFARKVGGGEYGSLVDTRTNHVDNGNITDGTTVAISTTTTTTSPAIMRMRMPSSNNSHSMLLGDERDDARDHHDGDWAVLVVERLLRQALLILGAYLLGVYRPQLSLYAQRVMEWCGVAWITCTVIIVLSYLKEYKIYSQHKPQQQPQQQVDEERMVVMPLQTKAAMTDDDDDDEMMIPLLVDRNRRPISDLEAPSSSTTSSSIPAPHPSLERLYVIDKLTTERIFPNTNTIHILETDLFSGQMVCMLRTPNVDHPDTFPMGTLMNQKVSDYFRSKQRRFEYQYQVRLKKKPEGKIFFACELDEPIKLGMVQRAIVSAAMAFMKTMNTSFHFSVHGGSSTTNNPTPATDSTSSSSGQQQYEKAHVGFPVEIGFDRLVVTKPGEPIPTLGEEIMEDAELVKQRKKGIVPIDWNTDDTYTFAVWTAYVDLLDWRILNLPGIRPFDLASVIGPQPINMVLYMVPPDREKHYRSEITIICEMEMSNTKATVLGPAARLWVAKHKHHSNMLQDSQGPEDVVVAVEEEEEEEMLAITGITSINEENGDDEEEEEEEAETASELGEGMYLRSGDSVILQEAFSDGSDEHVDLSFGVLSNGGGFAVMQNHASSEIVIEKAHQQRQRRNNNNQDRQFPSGSVRARSALVKSGDKIMIKLVGKNNNGEENDVKYLSIHRGWWLKWVSTPPTKNGFFTIHTHELEYNPSNENDAVYPSLETQTSYLTLGGSFRLRHQRWSKYEVGVSAKESTTYGGRMLGLFVSGSSSERFEEVNNPDDEDDAEPDADENAGSRKNSWMRPLVLSAHRSRAIGGFPPLLSRKPLFQMSSGDFSMPVTLSAGNFRIDVPGWIEMANRTDRRRQLLYILRISVDLATNNQGTDPEAYSDGTSGEEASTSKVVSITRLRTGDELAELIGLGRDLSLSFRVKKLSLPTLGMTPLRTRCASRTEVDEENVVSSEMQSDEGQLHIPRTPSVGFLELEESPRSLAGSNEAVSPSLSFDDDILNAATQELSDCEEDWGAQSFESEDGCDSVDGMSDVPDAPVDTTPTRKRNKLIGHIARSVKTGTSKSGKKIVKGSIQVGMGTVKGTVRTGKAIIAPISRKTAHPKNPPMKEPKSAKRKASRRREGRDHYVVVNRTLRRMSAGALGQLPRVLAGQLSAPDQSCRTASHILSGMCSEPESSEFSKRFVSALMAQIEKKSDFDAWFLQGGAIQMGVSSPINDQKLLHERAVARCLWESQWREEWCGVYETGIYFFAPLTNDPSLVLSFIDIQSVRRLDIAERSPLPGYSLLAVDTAWQSHYFVFSSEEARNETIEVVNACLFSSSGQLGSKAKEKDLWKARFWQGFQSSAESSLSSGKGKWATISSSTKMLHRTILNNRRMAFDIEPVVIEDDAEYLAQTSQFVADLLSTALSFSFESLESDPDAFVRFHDATSTLRTLSLERIDRSSAEAVCIFVNIYHCLLQHALLLSINGPLNKRSAHHFMRTTCYEIGGDVFSLAELNFCVIRGNLSRAVSPKAPYVDAPKKSNAYRFYALERVDTRINFVLNTGDHSCPKKVPVLTPDQVQKQLDAAASRFMESQLKVDVSKRTIVLPKICDVYRNDFGNGDCTVAIMYCVAFLDESDRGDVVRLLQSESIVPVYMKYQPASEQYRSCLKPWTEEDSTEQKSREATAAI